MVWGVCLEILIDCNSGTQFSENSHEVEIIHRQLDPATGRLFGTLRVQASGCKIQV